MLFVNITKTIEARELQFLTLNKKNTVIKKQQKTNDKAKEQGV